MLIPPGVGNQSKCRAALQEALLNMNVYTWSRTYSAHCKKMCSCFNLAWFPQLQCIYSRVATCPLCIIKSNAVVHALEQDGCTVKFPPFYVAEHVQVTMWLYCDLRWWIKPVPQIT